ncbi:AAA family ATPase [Botrimarina hoheduenensis]|nr:AAA family ATPase [Botrimarina hoheduenensis]
MPAGTTDSLAESLLPPDLVAAMRDRPTSPTSDRPTDAPLGVEWPAELPAPPPEPTTLAETGLTAGMVESLLLKLLLNMNTATSAALAQVSGLSRRVVTDTLARFRDDLMVSIRGSVGNDYDYQLTEAGHTRAKQHAEHANYADAAPVPLAVYDRAIRRQAIGATRIGAVQLQQALSDLEVADSMLSLVAQAVSDGRGMFLYGAPGNGKTSIAERICNAFGKHLWIPRAVCDGADILRLYDASCHDRIEHPALESTRYDRRWVLIKRPTVVVGGELTLEQLDPSYHAASGVSEAPVQMKANGGALVIDDFGRQRVSSTDLLNRLIVPLEKQFDYLSLASGRQARIPFELLFILSTNLEPRELVDEAFLRRIPYKIEVVDPTEVQFYKLLEVYAERLEMKLAPRIGEWLLAEHFHLQNRRPRFCHPRDLLRQARNFCVVHDRPLVADEETLGVAVHNYFAGL